MSKRENNVFYFLENIEAKGVKASCNIELNELMKLNEIKVKVIF